MSRATAVGSNEALPATRLARTPAALLFCVCLAAAAGEEPADPEAPQDTPKAEPTAEKTGEFKLPPGFRPKRHGDLILYCRREEVLGSRFKAEKCYDEAGIEELKRAELEKSEMMERIRQCGVGSCNTG